VPREPWRLGSALVEAAEVEHRGPTLGYRIEDGGRTLVYLPDHEPYLTAALDDEPRWISGWALAAGADLLLHDSQYTAEEYAGRVGWGHSSGGHAAAFARAAGVNRLALFHHDPMRSDQALEDLYDEVAELLRDHQEPPLIVREGLEIEL
jgi:ribonuclease BN (tRNA processing enzyme)